MSGLFRITAALAIVSGRADLRYAGIDPVAKQICADLIKRVRKAPGPDDSEVPEATTRGPRKPAGGAGAALALKTERNA